MTGQEALAAIKEMKESAHWYRGDHRMAAAIVVIDVLADKATPKKMKDIISNEAGKIGCCPKCDEIQNEDNNRNYCGDCGQHIYWSNDE